MTPTRRALSLKEPSPGEISDGREPDLKPDDRVATFRAKACRIGSHPSHPRRALSRLMQDAMGSGRARSPSSPSFGTYCLLDRRFLSNARRNELQQRAHHRPSQASALHLPPEVSPSRPFPVRVARSRGATEGILSALTLITLAVHVQALAELPVGPGASPQAPLSAQRTLCR